MIYCFKFAWRYLTSSKLQTGLLVLGVAVGVFAFVFISALIGPGRPEAAILAKLKNVVGTSAN
ncbi:ABC-type lipoprotein release transport system permease subunit [Shinella sp. BE166]|uniref:hypothetical protein n=1 Tax=Shinella sp. BE166 TaxID=3373918 RepID=UPI003EBD1B55